MITAITELLDKDKSDPTTKNIFSRPPYFSLTHRTCLVGGLFTRASMEGLDDPSNGRNVEQETISATSNTAFQTPPATISHVYPSSTTSQSSTSSQSSNSLWYNPFNWKHCTTPGCKEGDAVLTRLAPSTETQIQVIEWNMMDMKKFYPLSMVSSFFIRCVLYPLTLVKTKIQIQQKANVYNGTIDCFRKIYQGEGLRGLYKGFWVSAFQIISGVFYVTTYEGVRHSLYLRGVKDSHVRALIAGGCASVVGQTIIVPFDVISQHMMIVGMRQSNLPGGGVYNPLGIQYEGRTKTEITKAIAREIYTRDGFRGFYRGYFASLSTYVPNSALWWGFYQLYQDELIKIVPPGSSHLAVQCISAMLGGWTTTILTNPLDVCRARLQVQRLPSFPKTFVMLWHEEKYRIFTKGLSARLAQSGVFSTAIIVGYESIKRFSVNEDYRDIVRW